MSIKIGNVEISEQNKPVTIAEAAVEHLGSVKVAMRMAEVARDIGVDIIKFQMHLPKQEMLEGVIKFWGGSLDEILENYNLSIEDHKVLIQYCKELGIEYLCTPFCPDAVDILNDLGVNAFKTGSGEMSNFPLMERIANTGKPAIISTGMSTLEEVNDTVQFLKMHDVNFMLTNCTSIYPAPYETINLGLIKKYVEQFNVLVGHSDHTPDIWTSLGAVAHGAKVIEKHFTLNKNLKGPDFEVSLEPKDFQLMIEGIKKIHLASGREKIIHQDEKNVRDWAHHSVVSVCKINENQIIRNDMISVKRPGGGIPAKQIRDVVGKKAKKKIETNSLIKWEDLI